MATREQRAMSFGAIAGDYDRLRPGPPEEAVDWLVPERCRVAVDLAAGTGLLTRALAREVGLGRLRSRRRDITLPDGLFGPAEGASFAFTRAMTLSDILGMLTTYSGVITAPPQDREAGLARARAALERRFPGAAEIDVPMRSWCFRADRAHR